MLQKRESSFESLQYSPTMRAKYLIVVLLLSAHTGALFSFLIEDHRGSISGIDGTRIKRNAHEVKYFQLDTPIDLHCFDETNCPADDDIIEYAWRIGGYHLTVRDIASDYYPNYGFLENKGDILLTVTDETKENYLLHPAECWAAVKGDPEVHGEGSMTIKKSYTLLEAKRPTVTLSINGQDAAVFQGRESSVNTITCEAKGGDPATHISLIIDGKVVQDAKEPEIASYTKKFDLQDKGKEIICEAISSFELFQPIRKKISLDIITGIKRNGPEVKYFQLNTPIDLHCFDETNRPADDDIIKYEWRIGGYCQTVHDIDDYPNYDFLENKGDISLTVTDETKEINLLHPAECWAAVNGDPEVHEEIPMTIKKSYTLLEAKRPNVTVAINGQEAAVFRGRESCVNTITCEAKGGAPATNIALFVGGIKVQDAQEPEIASYKMKFDRRDNGKLIKYEVISPFELFQPISKTISLDITFLPTCSQCEAVQAAVDETLIDSFSFLSNPAPSTYTFGLKNCLVFENPQNFANGRLKFEKPAKLENSHDVYKSVFTLRNVEESDIGRCIFLRVSNDEGSAVFQKRITKTDGLSGGAIAGIVIAVIGLLILIISGLWKKYRSGKIKYSATPKIEEVQSTELSGKKITPTRRKQDFRRIRFPA